MRSVRIIFGLAVAVCAFSAFSASAFAKEPRFYGEFFANVPKTPLTHGEVKGKGEVSELRLGPFHQITCAKITTTGIVTEERSTSLPMNVKFSSCEVWIRLGEGVETRATLKVLIGLKFHSNGSAKTGIPTNLEIEPSEVTFKATGTKCLVVIPKQEITMQAEKRPEPEEAYEYASYETEEIALEKKKELEEFFPATVRDKLNIFMMFKGIRTEVVPSASCRYAKGEEGKFDEETGNILFKEGKFEGDFENIELRQSGVKGNIGFEA
ncbi:MAG TPA: hypothetical protein VKG78_02340 [Opitutaceae bacterium]|nr:hypothetical protein [Opitutaceae bacterium]